MLRNGWPGDATTTRPGRNILKSEAITHLAYRQHAAIGGAHAVHEDIALAGNAEHQAAGRFAGIEAMFPQAAGKRVVGMHVRQVTGHGQRLIPG